MAVADLARARGDAALDQAGVIQAVRIDERFRAEDARALLLAGADKVAVNSAAVARPALVGDMAERFGAQCVVGAIDAR
ncbi:MAG TPA: HisA/HisF-related TIM barrel protein, partial [Acidocella sp.]|nr:HisA/HisF-related TIM barrel protein [Acidocella sp.]